MNEFIKKSIVVTGASGLVGRALVEELRKNENYLVTPASSSDVNLLDFQATCEFMAQHRPDIVYHMAARVSGIAGNMRAHGRGYFDNVMMNTHVIEAARLASVKKIVGMGSTAVYSDLARLPMAEEEIWLGAPHSSEAGYAHAKRAMLAQLEAYREQYGIDYAFCLSTNLFGPHDKFDEQYGHVLPSLISKFHRGAMNNESVTIWGSGTPKRDFLYVKDAAVAIRTVGEKFSGAINLASGRSISIFDIATMLKDITSLTSDLLWDRSKPDGQKLRAYDLSKLSALGFQPKFSLEEALIETYEWYKAEFHRARR
jgi:GDP-L-fucose synthase